MHHPKKMGSVEAERLNMIRTSYKKVPSIMIRPVKMHPKTSGLTHMKPRFSKM